MNGRMIRTYGSNGRENLTRLAVSAAILTLTACGGGGSSSVDDADLDLTNLQEVPPSIGAATDGNINAATDVAEISAGETIVVGILNNDSFPTGTKFQLIGQPANGVARLLQSGELEYVADTDFVGTDSVDYALVAADGTISRGTLYIAVACADCDVAPPAPAAALAAKDQFGNTYCVEKDSDEDGDGYGWENGNSCVVPPVTSGTVGALTAKSDTVTLDAGSTTAVSALSNDIIADRASVQFAIDVQPGNGVVEAADTGVVVYTAPLDFEGTDSLVYSLTDKSGNTSVANIDFNVECAWCNTMKGLRLSWPANPANENVESYKVFFGPDENVHTSTELAEIKASDFTGSSAPTAVYDLANDLNISGNEGGCFRIKAVRGAEESDPSDPICFKLG